MSVSGDYEAEESSNRLYVRPRLNADRITEDWKFNLRVSASYREQNFEVEDNTITSIREDGFIWTRIVKSVSTHWSAGLSSFTNKSSRENRELSTSFGPAIEYSLFPYSESDQRSITFSYEIGYESVKYKEETVFDKTSESLIEHEAKVNLDYRQPRGSAHAQLDFQQYLTDFEEVKSKYYSLELDLSMNVRLVRGFNVNFGFKYDLVKDQLYLPKEELTEEEILLGTKRLPTSYEYSFRMGVSYNFGSIYNNVVNSRLSVF